MSGIHSSWVFIVSCKSASICYDTLNDVIYLQSSSSIPLEHLKCILFDKQQTLHICVGIQCALISYCTAPQCFPSFRRQPSLPTAPSSHTLYHLYLTATSRNSFCRTISERAPRCSSRGYPRLFLSSIPAFPDHPLPTRSSRRLSLLMMALQASAPVLGNVPLPSPTFTLVSQSIVAAKPLFAEDYVYNYTVIVSNSVNILACSITVPS